MWGGQGARRRSSTGGVSAQPGDQIAQGHVGVEVPDLQAPRPDVPAGLENVLRKATAMDPGGRYATAAGFPRSCLMRWDARLRSQSPINQSPPNPQRASRSSSSSGISSSRPIGRPYAFESWSSQT